MGLSLERVVIASILLTGAATVANADVIDITVPGTTLAQVIGNQFIVGNHLFTVSPSGFNSAAFTPSQIFITPLINPDPMTGAGFRLSGAFNGVPGAPASAFTLAYRVEETGAAQASGLRFDHASTLFNGAAAGAGSRSSVTEALSSTTEGALGTLSIFADADGTTNLQDQTTFASSSLTSLDVVDTASFLSAGDSGISSASFMNFSFGDRLVPAPAGILVLGAAAGVLGRRRR